MADQENVSADFVFGTLATDDLRLAQLRAAQLGVAHDTLSPLDPQPGEAVTVHVALGPAISADHVTCYYTTDASLPDGARGVASNGTAVTLFRVGVVWDTLLWGYREQWAGALRAQADGVLVRYRIEAWSSQNGVSIWASQIAGVVAGARPPGVADEDAKLFSFPDGAQLWPLRRDTGYAYRVDTDRVPDWLRNAVIYQVFIDRFAPPAGEAFDTTATPGGFYGGTLRGVTEHLDYIHTLGVTCLWLSPLFPSPSHHGYDATDYQSVEPRLGSDADLRGLIVAAHARGIRVILDFVANHMSSQHAAFQRALADTDSPERGWFRFTHWPDQYLTFFGVQDHPQIDADNPAAQAYLIDSARHWLERGADGFRLDYANGPSYGFWSAFRAATRAANPESVTLGEVVETAALQRSYAGRMDGCLDFLLMQALRQFFAFGTMTATAFDGFLRRHLGYFPTDFVLPSFLDNHDMNRFLWVVGGDVRRLKLAALCQFTLPNPPIVYYGTEVGLSQQRDVRYADGSGHPEESRLPMRWDAAQDADLLGFYRKLAALRNATAARWRNGRETLRADDTSGLYIYRCGDNAGAAIVVLNNGLTEAHVRLPAGSGALALATDRAVLLDGMRLTLPSYSGAIIQ